MCLAAAAAQRGHSAAPSPTRVRHVRRRGVHTASLAAAPSGAQAAANRPRLQGSGAMSINASSPRLCSSGAGLAHQAARAGRAGAPSSASCRGCGTAASRRPCSAPPGGRCPACAAPGRTLRQQGGQGQARRGVGLGGRAPVLLWRVLRLWRWCCSLGAVTGATADAAAPDATLPVPPMLLHCSIAAELPALPRRGSVARGVLASHRPC